MMIYVFFREEEWYPVECTDDDNAKKQAEMNPGTKKVEDRFGRIVWEPKT